MKRHIGALALGILALLALACAPAEEPAAAPAPAASTAPDVAAPVPQTPLEAAVSHPLEVPTTGKHIDRAGLRIFIPDGYEFGGPIIPADPRPPRYGGIGDLRPPGGPS